MSDIILGEFIGTAILLLLGNGVVANVALNKTKGSASGWIVISFGWGLAVFTAVFIIASMCNAHINPAVSLAMAMDGRITWGEFPNYVLAQMLGGAVGTTLVWAMYKDHFAATEDKDAKLAVFCTGPAIRNTVPNFLSEMIGTFVLVFGVFFIVADSSEAGLGSLHALPVGLLVTVIGLCLGGTTGYAINPARDLAPRLMHLLLPIPAKRDSDWSYSWIPVAGPLAGAALAALLYANIA